MSAQILPYNGTSGWAGSNASHERQMMIDETGETGKRQKQVIGELNHLGNYGATWREIATALGLHHGQASAALSILHREGLIARLTEKRAKCSIYVLPKFVNGRSTSDAMKTQTSANAKAIKAIRELHSITEVSEITGKTYCQECQYEYPCDTIKLVDHA